jgi:hypothetical protein
MTIFARSTAHHKNLSLIPLLRSMAKNKVTADVDIEAVFYFVYESLSEVESSDSDNKMADN